MDQIAALSRSFEQMQRTAAGVGTDQLDNATPCSEWNVRSLLEHAFGVVNGLGATAAGHSPRPFRLDEANVAGQFRDLADSALAGWNTPGVLERSIDGGAGPMPGARYAAINMVDTLVHSWDLAVATGQDSALPDELAAHALAACEGFLTPELRQFAGFKAAVPTADGATSTERLVAFLGRTP